jgi:poly(3-hydroxybutyrate) depolymerase
MNKAFSSSFTVKFIALAGCFFSAQTEASAPTGTTQAVVAATQLKGATKINFLKNIDVAAQTGATLITFTYYNSITQELSNRSVYVTVPQGFATAAKGSCPVYFYFHGTAPTNLPINAAESSCSSNVGSGCVCIVPLGSQLINSDGSTVYSWCVNNSTEENDLAFVKAVWKAIKNDPRLDLERVYAAGHSVGSLFVSNELAAGARFLTGCCCYSSQLLVDTDIALAPSPINVVTFHGAADNLIPANGGIASFNEELNFTSAKATIESWSAHNNYTGSITTSAHSFNYTASRPGAVAQPITYTKYSSPDTNAIVAGYVFDTIKHDSISPVLQLYGVATTAEVALKVFGGGLL